jgi:hypothetical protein
LGFVTERNTTVPLCVVSHDAVPDLTDQVLRADQARESGTVHGGSSADNRGTLTIGRKAYSVAVLPRFYGAEETAVAAQLFDIGGNAPTATAPGMASA